MYFCHVEVLNFIFRIGVILAVYNFLWWLIMLAISILRGGSPKMAFEVYFIKIIRYGFLVDVIYLFTVHQADGLSVVNDLIIAALILLLYFIGRAQKRQNRQMLFSMRMGGNVSGLESLMKSVRPAFDMRYEIAVITLSLGLFTTFYFFPNLAYNPISNWFLDSILNIEDTPVFGFVFKVIGFFFLLSVLSKIFGAIMLLLTGPPRDMSNDNRDDDDDFDDYVEIK